MESDVLPVITLLLRLASAGRSVKRTDGAPLVSLIAAYTYCSHPVNVLFDLVEPKATCQI